MIFSCAILVPNMTSYYIIMTGFLGIVLLAYFTSRWLFKSRFSGANGKNMQVIERMYLAADKVLVIVLVDKTYYLMSHDKNGIQLIDTLQDFQPNESIQDKKFSDILEKFKSVSKDK
jgi:flagellar biogenesis protein FliO